jgi:FkbM family methyltransferase
MNSKVKELLFQTPLFAPARLFYRSIFRRSQVAEYARMRRFYGQFFGQGNLVFDVGANQGEYAEVFADAGARVIAFEPNPAFRSRLRRLAAIKTIVPEFTAVGDEEGEATLKVCSQPGFSTLDGGTIQATKDSPDYRNVQWLSEVCVRVTTLDAMEKKFGMPAFVKIDVEGFESRVIRGMSFNPRFLSFEFGARRKHIALECIANLGLRGYRFRPILGRAVKFMSTDWMTHEQATSWVNAYSVNQGEYGDMFARF